tara:strand:+ start:2237 stop:2539 length:303 start_codon:yes stop_codon:yes gene_type:complete
MSKYSNIVRFSVKSDFEKEFLTIMSNGPTFKGQESSFLVRTNDREFGNIEFIAVGIWSSEESLANARHDMVNFLDTFRHMLVEMPQTGITDPRSGPIVVE